MKRFNLFTTVCIALIACGGGSSGTTPKKDAATTPDTGDDQIDAAVTCAFGDATGSGTTPTPTFDKQAAENRGSDFAGSDTPPGEIAVEWSGLIGSGGSAGDIIYAWITFSGGGSDTPDWPTSLGPKSAIDPSMAKDVVGIILTDFDGSGTAQIFYETDNQTGGVFNLTQAGSGSGATYAGNATDVGYVQLNDDGTAVNTDGCSTTVSTTFSATVQLEGSAFAPQAESHLTNFNQKQMDQAYNFFLTHRSH